MTGSVPGCAIHTGQMLTFGFFSSGSFFESQNIFVFVVSSACISSPMVGLYFGMLSIGSKNRQVLFEVLDEHQKDVFRVHRSRKFLRFFSHLLSSRAS